MIANILYKHCNSTKCSLFLTGIGDFNGIFKPKKNVSVKLLLLFFEGKKGEGREKEGFIEMNIQRDTGKPAKHTDAYCKTSRRYVQSKVDCLTKKRIVLNRIRRKNFVVIKNCEV